MIGLDKTVVVLEFHVFPTIYKLVLLELYGCFRYHYLWFS